MNKQASKTKLVDQCAKHNKLPYKYVCVSPACNFFVPLCENCLEEHSMNHLTEYEDVHPKILDLADLKQQLATSVKQSREILEEMLQGTHALFTAKNETILNSINNELDEIQACIKVHFEELKLDIKKTYELKLKVINNEVEKLYYDLRQALEFCLKYVNKPITLDSIKTLYTLDLPYQVAYKQEKKEFLTEKKNNMRFDAEISKEYRDKFFAHFDAALNELVAYENSPYRRPQPLEMSGFTDKIVNSYIGGKKKTFLMPYNKEESYFEIAPDMMVNENKRKWIFFFEENTKYLHYLDIVRSKNKSFEKVTLNIPFSVFPNHRCILAADGEIYVLGGYNGFINESNENDFLSLYRYDHLGRTLIPLEKMHTLRHSFGMCCIKNKIYVVGGANYREGALIKCECFDLKTLKWTRNNFLNIKSMNHCLAVYKDTHIFKFGGLRKNFTVAKELSLDLFERYDINADVWEKMRLKDCNGPCITYMSGCYAINENTIFVFGGKNEKHETVRQTYLINFTKNDNFVGGFSDRVEDNIFSIMETNTKSLPWGMYFMSPMAVVSGKMLYVCGYNHEKERKILSFDQKLWKNF